MKIAVVDDAKAVHMYLEDTFSESKAELTHYYNGQEALDNLPVGTQIPDVILLDWEMPLLTGIEALPQLRAALPQIPILMMTSKNSMSDIIEAMQKGANDYVIKPFTKDILFGKIEQVLGKKVG